MTRIVVALALSGAGLLAWALIEQLSAEDVPVPGPVVATPATGAPEPASPAGDDLPALAPLASLTETVERPLFLAGRRPVADAAPAAAPVESASASPPRAVLLGIVIVDEKPVAMLRAEGGSRRVRIGDDVEGWSVTSITPERVELARGKARHVVELRRFEPAPVVATPGPRADRSRPVAPGAQAEADEDPAAAVRPRRPRIGPRQAARERLQRQRSTPTQ